ncbi:MAG: TonB family protein [Rhodothermia bacterium]|nr:TonB family protein [Rhodothermia bacterium]
MENWLEALQWLGARVFFAFWLPLIAWSLVAWLLDHLLNRIEAPHKTLSLRLAVFWALPLGMVWASWGWLPQWEVPLVRPAVALEVQEVVFLVQNPAAAKPLFTVGLWYVFPLVLLVGIVIRGIWKAFLFWTSVQDVRALRTCLFPVQQNSANAEVLQIARCMDIQRPIALCTAERTFSPFTFGIFRPVLALPPELLLPSEGRTLAIRHELVHIRRFDVLWRLSEEGLLWIMGWHPFVHRYHHEILFAREATCDAEVLSGSHVSRQHYAQLLYHLLASESMRTNPLLSTMASAQFQQLKRRIQTMKKQLDKPPYKMRWWGLCLLIFAVGLTAVSGLLNRPKAFAKPIKNERILPTTSQSITPKQVLAPRTMREDTLKTILVNGKKKVIQTVIVRENFTKPIRVKFKDGTFLDMTSDEALGKGIVLPPPPPPPPPPPMRDKNGSKATNGVNGPDNKPDAKGIWTFVEKFPEFPGGLDSMNEYLTANVTYPESARKEGIEGPVFVQFVVGEDGQILDAMVVQGIGGGCDEEALRVVNAMPRWRPGSHQGMPVKVRYTVQMRFRLK